MVPSYLVYFGVFATRIIKLDNINCGLIIIIIYYFRTGAPPPHI